MGLTSSLRLEANALLSWSRADCRLGAWGFRGTPPRGAAMPMADVEADGKGPLVAFFLLWALGAGDTDCPV